MSNLPNLISGLESCKNIICDNTTTIDEKEKAWSQVVETVELLANAAKSGKFLRETFSIYIVYMFFFDRKAYIFFFF